MGIAVGTAPTIRTPTAAPVDEVQTAQPPAPLELQPSAVAQQYQTDGYQVAAPVANAPAEAPKDLSTADAIKISKEFGPEKLAQIRNLILLANTKGTMAPETLKAMATLINDNKGDFLKALVPFMGAVDDLKEAFTGQDASGKSLTAAQRIWSFFKGLISAAIDASPVTGASKAVTALGHAYVAGQLISGAEAASRYAPFIAELSKNGADPEVVAQFLKLAQQPSLLKQMQGGLKNAVTGTPTAAPVEGEPPITGG